MTKQPDNLNDPDWWFADPEDEQPVNVAPTPIAGDLYAIFDDEDIAGLTAMLERDVHSPLPDDDPEAIARAERFLRSMSPVLESIKHERVDTTSLLPLLEVAAEAVYAPLRRSPQIVSRNAWLNHVEAVREKQRGTGGQNKGEHKLAKHEIFVRRVFHECHPNGLKTGQRYRRKAMLARLESNGISVDPDWLTAFLKRIGLLSDRKR